MHVIKVVFFFLVALLFSACVSDEKPLKVAVSPWIGYESFYQAEEFGWLHKNTELVKSESLSDSFKKLLDGKVDAAAMTMEDVLLARSKGVNLSIIAVLDISAGADVILSKTPVESLADIKGKRIGKESSSLSSLMLIKMLEKAGLQQDDVTLLDLLPAQQIEAWKKDQIDMVITYEPYASELFGIGAYYVLSSREFPEMIFDVLAVRTDRLEGRESAVKKLLQSHFKTLEYFRSNYTDALYRIAAREGNTVDDIKRALGGIVLPSKTANQAFFMKGSNLYQSAEMLNRLMSEKELITHKDTLDNFTDPVFLKE